MKEPMPTGGGGAPEPPPRGAETARLVEDASHGNREAILALLDRFAPALRAFVRLNAGAVIRAKESSSDLVQSVCREVLEGVGAIRYEGEAAFKQWLFTAAMRKIYDRQKYYRAEKRDSARETPRGGEDLSRLAACYGPLTTPSRHAMARESMRRVEAAFDELAPEHREIITLARLVGLSHAEIAQQTGRTEAACRQLLARALGKLAVLIERDRSG